MVMFGVMAAACAWLQIPSDNVPFNELPDMKAAEITAAGKEALVSKKFDMVRINYANPDMVRTCALHAVPLLNRQRWLNSYPHDTRHKSSRGGQGADAAMCSRGSIAQSLCCCAGLNVGSGRAASAACVLSFTHRK
jgi:Metalloenzyme superfamily